MLIMSRENIERVSDLYISLTSDDITKITRFILCEKTFFSGKGQNTVNKTKLKHAKSPVNRIIFIETALSVEER